LSGPVSGVENSPTVIEPEDRGTQNERHSGSRSRSGPPPPALELIGRSRHGDRGRGCRNCQESKRTQAAAVPNADHGNHGIDGTSCIADATP
jgi:hypothetical protein